MEKKTEEIVKIGGLTVDFTARRVTVDGTEADLSPKEYDLLFYMIRNRGIALTREKLISDVWGYDFFGDDRTLDTHIKLLRKQLGAFGFQADQFASAVQLVPALTSKRWGSGGRGRGYGLLGGERGQQAAQLLHTASIARGHQVALLGGDAMLVYSRIQQGVQFGVGPFGA